MALWIWGCAPLVCGSPLALADEEIEITFSYWDGSGHRLAALRSPGRGTVRRYRIKSARPEKGRPLRGLKNGAPRNASGPGERRRGLCVTSGGGEKGPRLGVDLRDRLIAPTSGREGGISGGSAPLCRGPSGGAGRAPIGCLNFRLHGNGSSRAPIGCRRFCLHSNGSLRAPIGCCHFCLHGNGSSRAPIGCRQFCPHGDKHADSYWLLSSRVPIGCRQFCLHSNGSS